MCIIIYPITVSTAVALIFSGVLTPIAGIGNLVAHLCGWEIHLLMFATHSLNPWLALPFSVLAGALLLAVGYLFWIISVVIFRWLMRIKPHAALPDSKSNNYLEPYAAH